MSCERFYIERPPASRTVRLSPDESHHLRRVRRVNVGDDVVLFDGSGTDYLGRVKAFDRSGVTVEIVGEETTRREPDVAVTLAVSVVKQGAMHQLIDACTQLGVKKLIPIRTARTVAKPGAGKPARWRRIAVEACKQCGRSIVPEVAPVVHLDDVLRQVNEHDVAVIASTGSDARPVARVVAPSAGRVLCLVGPEGGFTDAERAAALDAGCLPVSLSRSILRTETAAAAALAQMVGVAST